MPALDILAQQLWSPGLGEGTRIAVDPAPESGWQDAERYWLLPGAEHPKLLVPLASPRVQQAALTHYRGLRRAPANLARVALGAGARMGAPLSRRQLAVQVRSDADAAELPLAKIASELGHEHLFATFGVRTGANRKTTMQLLDDRARAIGYAKLGWNSTADEYVTTESHALRQVGGRVGLMRAPRLLASFRQGGRPVLVVEPLPAGVRGVRGEQAAPSSAELFALGPVERMTRPGSTIGLRAIARRLDVLRADPTTRTVAERATALLRRLEAHSEPVPVQARWHGDLTPWNCAREADGQLWAWDWESSEPDVVAGLDAVHWEFSVQREAIPVDRISLTACVGRARHHLAAAGHDRVGHGIVGAVHALTVVERAATLAAREGGWQRVWITPVQLARLVDEAMTLVG
ncbi:hypothetical protein [Nocardioides gilvus]|uniref:hypothetical protein n=1 Tax=Nocardioides gilvus TaxID=1735589 RepID=UPI0013A53889|nr:hypothetical protein [Nocardioides gilvus]